MKSVPEAYFPRGGRKPSAKVKKTLFGKSKKLRVKKKIVRKRGPITRSEPENITAKFADPLTYKSIQEGMIILAAVREIRPMHLNISLPGRLSARAPITNISAPYTQLLQSLVESDKQPEGYRTLNQLFECGQHVVCKVVDLARATGSDLFEVTVTLAPNQIYSSLRHNNLFDHMLVTAAVISIEDHGYVMDLGVKNCRAFLPKSNTVKTLHIGQLVWCEISKIVTSNVASTVTLNAIENDIFKSKIKEEKTLNELFPGMKVEFTVNKILSNGLQGTFLNDFTGYINETQLKTPLDNLNKYQEGQRYNACVLYTMPTTKFTYLTLQNLKSAQVVDQSVGKILEAKVLSRAGKGLFLSLPDEDKGYASFHRLKLKTPVDKESLLKSYPVGSSHNCRIIGYEYMDRVYICTLEKEALDQKIFTADDLEPGNFVTAIVNEVKSDGISVTIGNLSAFVQNLHMSDIPLSSMTQALKKKFTPGQKLKARVLQIHPETKRVSLTLKQSLLHSKSPCVTSFEDIKKGDQCLGYVVRVSENGLLVGFYGNVKGWIPKSRLSFEPIKNPEKMFSIGQVVKCTVVHSDPSVNKLMLSLTNVNEGDTKFIDKGELVQGTVNKICETGLQLALKENRMVFLPSLHLTDHPTLAQVLLQTYSKGDIVNNLICINSGYGTPTVSLRDFQYFKAGIPEWDEVKPETILHCSVQEVCKNSILLLTPIKGFERLIVVPTSELGDFSVDTPADLNIQKHQSLAAKVLSIDRGNKAVSATTKLSSCWDGSLKAGIDLLTSYIIDINKVHENWVSKRKPLVGLSLGQQVKGTVVSPIKDGFCSIKLENDIDATAPLGHFNLKIKKGETVNGTVMWLDYANNLAVITLLPKYMDSIGSKQDNTKLIDKKGRCLRATVLLVRSDVIVAALKGSGKGQLIVLPAQLHQNDIKPAISTYRVGNIIKIIIYKNIRTYSIGLLRDLVKLDVVLKKEILTINKPEQMNKKKINSSDGATVRKRNLSHGSNDSDLPKKQSKSNVCKVVSANGLENTKQKKTVSNKQNKRSESYKNKIQPEEKEHGSSEKTKRKRSVIELENDEITSELPLSGADNFWNLEPEMLKDDKSNDLSSESDEENKEEKVGDKKKKMTKAERAEAARQEEIRIRQIEERLADTDAPPTSADQFDRLVISKPNSSMAWISYMAYHLQSTEIEKARAIAKKALDTISFREEQEKLNVWLALLNLENRYGTKDSFSSVLEEAVRMNDALTVHTRALMMLADTGKQAEMHELLNKIVRRYKHEPEAWYQAATACFIASLPEKARSLLQRALSGLDQKHHVDFIVKFALLEVKHGDTERAETLFEQVLTSYPRRVDIWIVYVDMLIKAKKIDIARKLLERSVSLKLPARKMKTLFKKFVEFEQTYGNEEKVTAVRKLAAEYVQNATE